VSFVRIRQTLAEAAAGKHRLFRDLESCSIFDFFDSIDPKRKFETLPNLRKRGFYFVRRNRLNWKR